MKDITPQQQKVLDCIQVYINKTGFPPTRANICRELGFKSPNSAETHLRALEKKGFIRRNKKLEYTLGQAKNLKAFQTNYLINQKNLSDFCTTLFNLMKNSKFKIN